MINRKIGGNKYTKEDKYIKEVLKKDKNSHIPYLNDYILIPEHYEMKMQTYVSFRDYVNKRKNFNDPSALIFDIYFRYFKVRS